MKIDSLEELYIENLRDLYSAENQLLKALPKVASAATSPDLREAFTSHLEETKGQVERLTQIFARHKEEPGGHECQAMKGLIKEADEVIQDVKKGDVMDAALIGAAQRVEHYEMAGYGVAKAYALQLGFEEDAELLDQTLDEERSADEKLTDIAYESVNESADDKRSSPVKAAGQ